MCYERREPNIARECWERDQGVKAMNRLTRPGVHVDACAAKYIGNETKIQDVGDRLLELILNGPTLMAFNKDKLRHVMRQLYARLEQYENTGLTQGEIERIKAGIHRIWETLQCIDEEDLKHLEELVDAENEGRMQILPCKPGETVYTNLAMSGWYLKQKDKPYPAKVVFIGLNGEDSMGGGIFNVVYEKSAHMMQFQFSEIGKSVFLTKEEAEAALAADKNDGCKKVNDLYDEDGGEIVGETKDG